MDAWVQIAMHLHGLTWEQFRRMKHRDRVLMCQALDRCLKPMPGT